MSDSLERAFSSCSLLAVPGHRPDRFAKAAHSGADSIMLDLEDAVGTVQKEIARKNVRQWLDDGGIGVVRINGIESRWCIGDLEELSGAARVVIVPKVHGAEELGEVLGRLAPGSSMIPLIETAAGVLSAGEICTAPGVVRVMFGNADLGADLGVDPADREALSYARSQVVIASAAAGLLPPFDGVTTDMQDEVTLAGDARHAVSMGFTGKLCIHPRQVSVVNAVMKPTADDIAWAHAVLAAAERDGSVASLNGQIVGRPIIERAKRILTSVQDKGSTVPPQRRDKPWSMAWAER